MRERGILFRAPLVRAILSGVKSQTRRLVKPQPQAWEGNPAFLLWRGDDPKTLQHLVERCPYGLPGDRLWVRETWRTHERESDGVDGILFRADNAFVEIENSRTASDRWIEANANGEHGEKWRPSIFMPRWVSRITLELTDVRVQRLQEITEEDARAEGVVPQEWVDANQFRSHCFAFHNIWEEINGAKASWASNPWVWSITFRRLP